MDLTVGAIIEGKVKSITNFGAFIALPENTAYRWPAFSSTRRLEETNCV